MHAKGASSKTSEAVLWLSRMTRPEQPFPSTATTFHPQDSLRETQEGRCPPHPRAASAGRSNFPRGRAGAPHGPASPPPPSRPSAPALPPPHLPRRRLRNGRLWLRAAGGWHTAEAAAAGARSEPTLPLRMTRGAPALTSLVPAANREQPRSRAGREHGKHGAELPERNRAVFATLFSLGSLPDGTPSGSGYGS